MGDYRGHISAYREMDSDVFFRGRADFSSSHSPICHQMLLMLRYRPNFGSRATGIGKAYLVPESSFPALVAGNVTVRSNNVLGLQSQLLHVPFMLFTHAFPLLLANV